MQSQPAKLHGSHWLGLRCRTGAAKCATSCLSQHDFGAAGGTSKQHQRWQTTKAPGHTSAREQLLFLLPAQCDSGSRSTVQRQPHTTHLSCCWELLQSELLQLLLDHKQF